MLSGFNHHGWFFFFLLFYFSETFELFNSAVYLLKLQVCCISENQVLGTH